MKCFQNILILAPQVEGMDTALERPVALAQASGAAITVVDVLDSAVPQVESTTPGGRTRREEQLKQLVEPFKRCGVSIVRRAITGQAVPEIVSQIELNAHDLVVVPAPAQRPVRGRLVGIPIVPLMRRCPCPVWVMKPSQTLRGGILVAVNSGPAEDQRSALGPSLIRLAACFSCALRSPLSILHVWHLIGESQIRRPFVGARPEQITALLDKAYKRARLHMKHLLDSIDLEGIKYELHFEEGHQPAKVIAEFAVRRQVETVVMGMTEHRGVARFLVGNSAEEVLRGVPGSVVTLRSGRSFPPIGPESGSLTTK